MKNNPNVKASKAYNKAGFKETARLMKLLLKTHTIPKSLQGEPLSATEW